MLEGVMDQAGVRRQAGQQLADVRRRLAAAEDTETGTRAALKDAEAEYDAASDRVAAAERALDEARADRGQALRTRYAARQAHERASALAERLQRRVDEISGRLDRMPLAVAAPRGCEPWGCLRRHTAKQGHGLAHKREPPTGERGRWGVLLRS
jgi:chromosome segregation ATPase